MVPWSHSNFAIDFRAPGAYPRLLLICFHVFLSICFLFVLVYLMDLLFFLANKLLTSKNYYCFSELYQLSEL